MPAVLVKRKSNTQCVFLLCYKKDKTNINNTKTTTNTANNEVYK